MARRETLCNIAMVAMAVISFSNLLGVTAAGAAVLIGVVMFFVNKAAGREPSAGSGLDIRAIGANLSDKSIWLWIALPLVMDGVSLALARAVLPGYIDHVLTRTALFVSLGRPAMLVPQLAVLAVGEEIAWRAFFQRQAQKRLPVAPVILAASLLFAIGHVTQGRLVIVAYDVFFVFVNSLLYSVIFQKTNNAWVSGLAHFIANLASVMVLAVR